MQSQYDRVAFAEIIDAALEEFRSRELVHAAEVRDVLLDLRLTLLADDPVADLVAAIRS